MNWFQRWSIRCGIGLVAAGWGGITTVAFVAPSLDLNSGVAQVALTILSVSLAVIMCGCTAVIVGQRPNRPEHRSMRRDTSQFERLVSQSASVSGRPPVTDADMVPTQAIIARGQLGGREQLLLKDGSVIVETRLGRRRFASIADAREFIGA
jgi:hypothetical protein